MSDSAAAPSNASAELQALERSLAVVVFAADGEVLRASAKFLTLFGYRAREVIGQPSSMFLPAQALADPVYANFWAALRAGKFREAEHPHLRKDGSLFWLRVSYSPVADAQGRVFEVMALATDITADKLRASDDRGQITAINTSQAVIHFALDGTVLDANGQFLQATGFALGEIAGAHHRMFVDPAHAQSAEYQAFWAELAQGRHQAGVYRRLGKNGREVWLQATYNPILDMNGQLFKIVKYATDVTAEKLRRVDHEGQLAAIDKSHGVITFDMNGTVLDANENFLEAFGYRIDEVEGRHHRMFVDPSYAHGPEYAAFWHQLSEGQHQAGEYKRFGKHGREVWLQASYNPVYDLNGRLFKVVKYATVVTREKLRQADHQGQIASIHKARCVVSFGLDGTVLDANDNFLDATGYRLAELRGQRHQMFVDEATAASPEYQALWADLARGRQQSGDFRRLRKDGREIWLQASYNPIFDMNGRPFKVVKYATDVTEERLRQVDNEGQLAAIRKSQCVVSFDMNGTVLEANDNFLAAMGYRKGEIEGRHHRMFVDPALAQSEAYESFWNTLRAGTFVSEKCRRIGKGGKEVWIQATYNPIFDLNGRPFKVVKMATDVSADVALAASFVSAKRQAEHDAGTALPNRIGLANFMAGALGTPASRLAILYLDLDHFKPINDTFGHDVGDLVLRETANRLRQAIAAAHIVARVGGDEFVVAAPNLADEEIDVLCQRLIDVVKAPIHHENVALSVGLSIGVAVSPGDATSADDLLRCADVALYRTKGNGRGSYSFFAAEMHERLSANRYLAEEMRHGIKAGQFWLDYQPRFDARTQALRSVAVLVRWAHPERGLLGAADFIGLAEKSGLVVPLGEWVLRTACHAAAGWPGIGVSVSVSPTQFFGTDLAQLVAAVLADSGLPPERLELELAERMLVDDAERSRAGLKALKALGVRLALDDYGSHHHTLGSLRDFALDAVTLDRRFMADLEGEPGGHAIVEAILGLGQTLSASMTASGVATSGHLLTVDLDEDGAVSGYLLARPMPAQALAALLQAEEAPALVD